uniref:THAP-type domain-containing protein n=1 Tax=Poecilia mexicana TaxID=48701 RepID=A0A3B3WI03_9TELE
MKSTQKIKYLRATGTTSEFCCVPLCPVSSRCNKFLSFFSFPADEELRKQWIVAIRRANLAIKGHTRVCSRHFKPEDIKEPEKEMGRRRLRKGAVPALFEWNNFSLPLPPPAVWETRKRPPPEDSEEEANPPANVCIKEHDYASAPDPAVMDLVFASYDLLMRFWSMIEPALPSMISIRQGQRGAAIDSASSTQTLQPIDEFFLFLNYLALGSKQWDLADRYGVHQSTVSWIVTAWTNFLFTVLGSIRIWIPEDQIHSHLPADFKDYPDTTVILDCTELRCQCPSSPILQSEVFSSYKSHCTLKGLIGVAPHGAVTFISGLYAGSINDKQITRESGLLTLLKPGMAVMVYRGLLIDDIVPCKVYRPAFFFGRSQMSAREVRGTPAITRLGVHVESLIRRVKEHKLFDSEIPLGVLGIINQLYTVACLLTNYENGPLTKGLGKEA